jgi:hypothetical protein
LATAAIEPVEVELVELLKFAAVAAIGSHHAYGSTSPGSPSSHRVKPSNETALATAVLEHTTPKEPSAVTPVAGVAFLVKICPLLVATKVDVEEVNHPVKPWVVEEPLIKIPFAGKPLFVPPAPGAIVAVHPVCVERLVGSWADSPETSAQIYQIHPLIFAFATLDVSRDMTISRTYVTTVPVGVNVAPEVEPVTTCELSKVPVCGMITAHPERPTGSHTYPNSSPSAALVACVTVSPWRNVPVGAALSGTLTVDGPRIAIHPPDVASVRLFVLVT